MARGLTPIAIVGLSAVLVAMPWSRDMERGPTTELRDAALTPPDGTLSIRGERAMSRDDMATTLTSPITASPQTLEQGRVLFDVYCTVCHGTTGAGDGPVGLKYPFPVPSLSADFIKARSDGYLYGTIRQGGFIMPRYAEVMSPSERWLVVAYIRSLQTP